MLRFWTSIFSLLGFFLPLTPSVCAGKKDLRILTLGEQISFPLKAGTRFSVGNREVISARPLNNGPGKALLLIRAKRQGYSDLGLFLPDGKKEKYSYRVVSKRSGSKMEDAKRFLGGMKNLKLIPNGNNWILQGTVQNVHQQRIIEAFLKQNKGSVSDASVLSKELIKTLKRDIHKLLLETGYRELQVRVFGKKLWIEGEVRGEEKKKFLQNLVNSIFPGISFRIKTSIDERKVIRFKVRLLELLKMDDKSFGFRWSREIPKIFSIYNRLTKTNFNMEAAMDVLSQKGYVRLLSEPEILVNEKGQAQLQVGGEIPLRLKSRSRQNITWRPYGLELKIEVPGTSKDLVRTKLSISASNLDLSNEIDGIPGIKMNRMETVVDLSKEKTIFLFGLMQNREKEVKSSLPILGNIPILGELFRSKNFQNKKSELVIAITALEKRQHNANK